MTVIFQKRNCRANEDENLHHKSTHEVPYSMKNKMKQNK